MFRRSYDAAGASGRWSAKAAMPAPNAQSLAARPLLGARAAYEAANGPYINAVINAIVANMIGDGPSIRHDVAQLVAAWNAFCGRCDAEGLTELGGLLRRIERSRQVSGEAFIHFTTDPEADELRLRLLSPEQIDPSYSAELGGGDIVVSGVEMDGNGRRLAYHVLTTAPDAPFAGAATERQRIPAGDIAHIFEPDWPGQVRGVTPLAAVLTRSHEVHKLEEAILVQENTKAQFAGFIRELDGETGLTDPAGRNPNAVSLEPGTMQVLPPGSDVTFTPRADSAGQPELARHMVRSIAAGAGVPYELVSHDLSQVNYSSYRAGHHEFRRRIAALQRSLYMRFLERTFRRFVAVEVIAGRRDVDVETLEAPTFIFPGWQPLDPKVETEADIAAIGAGLKSRAEVIAARGRDPEEVDAEIAADSRRSAPETANA